MKKGFSLIELLIVIGIVAILAVVLVLTLNPLELIRQSRDASRISGMTTINKAVSLYYSDALNNPKTFFMGSSSVIYVSIPDSSSTVCADLGLPTLPSGWIYHCSSSANYLKTDGTGWMPITFNAYSAGNIISSLPIDPVNATSSNLYYTYETDGTNGYRTTAFFESQKYAPLMASDGGSDPELYEKGTNLALVSGRGLIGYWPFDDGAGTAAADLSGNGNSGALINSNNSTCNGPGWAIGHVNGAYSNPDNGCEYVEVGKPATLTTTSSVSLAAWFYATSFPGVDDQNIISRDGITSQGAPWNLTEGYKISVTQDGGPRQLYFIVSGNGQDGGSPSQEMAQPDTQELMTTSLIATGTWYYVVGVFNAPAQTMDIYLNGVSVDGTRWGTIPSSLYATASQDTEIGTTDAATNYPNDIFDGNLDDVRIYSRALSAPEIQEMYNAEK